MGASNPVVVRGVVYSSQKEAAEALGVGQSAIAQALIRRGHLDFVGLEGRPYLRGIAKPARPVGTVIFGHRFESRSAAAKALNVSRATVRRIANGEHSKMRDEVYASLLRAKFRDSGDSKK